MLLRKPQPPEIKRVTNAAMGLVFVLVTAFAGFQCSATNKTDPMHSANVGADLTVVQLQPIGQLPIPAQVCLASTEHPLDKRSRTLGRKAVVGFLRGLQQDVFTGLDRPAADAPYFVDTDPKVPLPSGPLRFTRGRILDATEGLLDEHDDLLFLEIRLLSRVGDFDRNWAVIVQTVLRGLGRMGEYPIYSETWCAMQFNAKTIGFVPTAGVYFD